MMRAKKMRKMKKMKKKDNEWLKTILLLLLVLVAAMILVARILTEPEQQDSGSALEIHPPIEEKYEVAEYAMLVKPARIPEQNFTGPSELILVIPDSETVGDPMEMKAIVPVKSRVHAGDMWVVEPRINPEIPEETTEPVPQQITSKLENAGVATIPEDEHAEEEALQQINEAELEMLACAIYQEAGSDYISDETRYRVGDIILNRIASDKFPDTMEGVLTERAQYGEYYWTGICWLTRASYPEETAAVQRAYDTALALLSNERHSELYGQGYVYQAEFSQGQDVVYADGLYFGR